MNIMRKELASSKISSLTPLTTIRTKSCSSVKPAPTELKHPQQDDAVSEPVENLKEESMASANSGDRSHSSSDGSSHGSKRSKHERSEGMEPAVPGVSHVRSFTDSNSHHEPGSPVFSNKPESPVFSEPISPFLPHYARNKLPEVSPLKQEQRGDLYAAKFSELMKSFNVDNAPTQALLSVVNGILTESIERKNGELTQRVALMMKNVVQEIERRISSQAEHIRNQNNIFKAREEKYQSRIKVLETLARPTEEIQATINQVQLIKKDNTIIVEKQQSEEQDVAKLTKEKEERDHIISELKQELELKNKSHQHLASKAKETMVQLEERIKELECLLAESTKKTIGVEKKQSEEQDVVAKLIKEKEDRDHIISELQQELELNIKSHEHQHQHLETDAKKTKIQLEVRIKDLECLLSESKKKINELEAFYKSKFQAWNQKENAVKNFLQFHLQAVQDLRAESNSTKHGIMSIQKHWSDEVMNFGKKLKALAEAADNYRTVLAENKKLFNEIQELRGNIRVYCRIRPFLPGENGKATTIDSIGDNGELVLANPSKQGKDRNRMFKFNKVYGPTTTQGEVFFDIQPLVRSVLDGYNVCIFAYGQTGSGKTYTMMGPDSATEEEWGVNYRALNDLFHISKNRSGAFSYEVGVQMMEIYNEQVRDLLSNEVSQKRFGIRSIPQPNGVAVPDASTHSVKSTSDVMDLMEAGFANRAVSATSMNTRSSRSHSVLTVHVRGADLKTGSVSTGCLHLIDLAGSERVDRSEVIGDRLKEAQHINKSLSALGDVIFALSQKSAHVPYRNSKLTQVLQSSLGGQAKTLMFVQVNPDIVSYSETLSTLKFAERVSGVELGAAKSNKDSKDATDFMEQVASLKEIIAIKDEEIERLQQVKYRGMHQSSSSPGNLSLETSTQLSMDDFEAKLSEGDASEIEFSGNGDEESDKKSSEICDAIKSVVEPEAGRSTDTAIDKMRRVASRVPKPAPLKTSGTLTLSKPRLKELVKSPSLRRGTTTPATTTSNKLPKRGP